MPVVIKILLLLCLYIQRLGHRNDILVVNILALFCQGFAHNCNMNQVISLTHLFHNCSEISTCSRTVSMVPNVFPFTYVHHRGSIFIMYSEGHRLGYAAKLSCNRIKSLLHAKAFFSMLVVISYVHLTNVCPSQ